MELPYLKTSRHYRIGSHGHLQTVRNSMTTYVRGRWGARAAGRSARTWWKAKHLNVAVSVIKSDDKNKLSPPPRGGARCFFPQAHVLPNSRGRRIGDVLREWRTLRDVLYAPSVRTLYVSVSMLPASLILPADVAWSSCRVDIEGENIYLYFSSDR